MSLLLLFGNAATTPAPTSTAPMFPAVLTGALGGPNSTGGQLQPGYFCRGIARWRGNFPMTVQFAPWGDANNALHPIGDSFQVTPAVASQLAAGDPDSWEFH